MQPHDPSCILAPREGIQAARPGSVLEVLSCRAEATAQLILSGTERPREAGNPHSRTPQKFNAKKDNKTDNQSMTSLQTKNRKVFKNFKIKSICNPLREKCDVSKNKKFETKEEKKR